MDVLSGPVVVLDGNDCAVLGPQLVAAIKLAYVTRGRPPPRHLLDFADQVNALVRAAKGRTDAQANTPHGPAAGREWPLLPALDPEPAKLTTNEAARLAEVDARTVRKWIQKRDLEASRDHKGAYLVDIGSLAAVIGRRRKENQRKAA